MAGPDTLAETERMAADRLSGMNLDHQAMAVVSNLFRAANSVRNYIERNVLATSDLTWTAFVVMWVCWIWGPTETRVVAEESGISKATLSGVLNTLGKRGLVTRDRDPVDGRLVIASLTPTGTELLERLFPKINDAEREVSRLIEGDQREQAAALLRSLVRATN